MWWMTLKLPLKETLVSNILTNNSSAKDSSLLSTQCFTHTHTHTHTHAHNDKNLTIFISNSKAVSLVLGTFSGSFGVLLFCIFEKHIQVKAEWETREKPGRWKQKQKDFPHTHAYTPPNLLPRGASLVPGGALHLLGQLRASWGRTLRGPRRGALGSNISLLLNSTLFHTHPSLGSSLRRSPKPQLPGPAPASYCLQHLYVLDSFYPQGLLPVWAATPSQRLSQPTGKQALHPSHLRLLTSVPNSSFRHQLKGIAQHFGE